MFELTSVVVNKVLLLMLPTFGWIHESLRFAPLYTWVYQAWISNQLVAGIVT